MFVTDGFGAYAKVLVLLGSALSIIIAMGYNEQHGIARCEFPVLILHRHRRHDDDDLGERSHLALYRARTAEPVALRAWRAFARDSERSSEAGLKYFVLGALASGMLLYGASMVYGFAGTTNFDALAHLFANGGTRPIGLIIGIVFISVGLAFKCSAVPFHMWTPDVYEGAPTPVTAFFSVAPKTAAHRALRARHGRAVRRPRRRMAPGHLVHRRRLDAAGRLRRHQSAQHQAPDGL